MMQLTLVTGNNQKNTISEFKATDFDSLKPSLCTLVLHVTEHYVNYGIVHQNEFKYLKKINYSNDLYAVLDNEFEKQNAFFEVYTIVHGVNTSIIPSSFFQGNTMRFGLPKLRETEQTISTEIDSNKKGIIAMHKTTLEDINKSFPETKYLSTIAPIAKSLPKEGVQLAVINESSKTQILLVKDGNTLLCESYDCPSATEVLFFTLSALKVNHIEDQSICTFHLACDERGAEIKSLFEGYFENIKLFSSQVGMYGFPLSKEDRINYQLVLSAISCVS